MIDIGQINRFLQEKLIEQHRVSVGTVEAARWLEEAELLKDSKSHSGWNLRKLLRGGRIDGQIKLPNGRWSIRVVEIGSATQLGFESSSKIGEVRAEITKDDATRVIASLCHPKIRANRAEALNQESLIPRDRGIYAWYICR